MDKSGRIHYLEIRMKPRTKHKKKDLKRSFFLPMLRRKDIDIYAYITIYASYMPIWALPYCAGR